MKTTKTTLLALTALFATLLVTPLPCLAQPASTAPVAPSAWAPKRVSLMTKWAALVNPKAPLPEYPRPQLVRADWQNLNGIWQYQPGAEGDAMPTGKTLISQILVPYPVESALSGVMEHSVFCDDPNIGCRTGRE